MTDFEPTDTLVVPLDLSQSRGIIIGGTGGDTGQRNNADGWLLEILVTEVGTGVEISFASRGFSLATPDVPTAQVQLDGVAIEDVSFDWFEFV